MYQYILFTLLAIPNLVLALESPFPSTVEGLNIRNAHQVDTHLFRGMAPNGKIKDLKTFGITDVLIFKSQGRSEVDQEITELLENGYTPNRITHIPFGWKDFESYSMACEKLIQGLQILRRIQQSKTPRKLFFHCTVGEDRTGMLAGLWTMLTSAQSSERVFTEQMCHHGYGRGNPQKPPFVVDAIRSGLTPLFDAMVKMIENGNIRLDYLRKSVCRNIEILPSERKCEVSPLYPDQNHQE